MDGQLMRAMKREFKAQDKLIKLVKRISRLPAALKKEVESAIGEPMDDKKINALIKEYEESKRRLEEEIEKQKGEAD